MIREKSAGVMNGGIMLTLLLASLVGVFLLLREGLIQASGALVVAGVLLLIVTVLGFVGLLVVSPGEARVLQLLGGYSGTVKEPGFWWTNPFTAPRRRVSLRVRNFESAKLKVNDHSGNPIEIAAVVVWQVVDTAEALFQVDDYNNFVKVQTEAALRNLATAYPYDTHVDGQISLRSATGEAMGERKPFLLRLDPLVYDALQRWAAADLRSLNAQIEFVLRRALSENGRLPRALEKARKGEK